MTYQQHFGASRPAPPPAAVRHSTLWGGRRSRLAATAAAAMALTAAAVQPATAGTAYQASVPVSLMNAAKASPTATFDVLVMGTKVKNTNAVASAVANAKRLKPGTSKGTKRTFTVVNGVTAQVTGAQLVALSADTSVRAISRDAKTAATGLTNTQVWPNTTELNGFWTSTLTAPAIAVVDSGVDATRSADFGARVLTQQSFVTTGAVNSAGDGNGHGTLVAGLAAGAGTGFTGAAPQAKIVSLDVLDDQGAGTIGDVVAAADWIYANKAKYNIKVANFSLTGSIESSFMYDPLCQAVEKLWLSGVTVVAAAGNYAVDGAQSDVLYAPGSDPFVITVGAADTNATTGVNDDFVAPWSAWGYTPDGFAKPELAAPGRYMNGPVPAGSRLPQEAPERVVAPGYMWMSGTSFASPVVAGAAAHLMAKYPTWTPDQVKGALMVTAEPIDGTLTASPGVGQIKVQRAAAVTAPPNPNQALNTFLVADPNGGTTKVFDAAAWRSAALADATWNSGTWSQAAWRSATWSSETWASAAWRSAAWRSAAWASGQTGEQSLPAGTSKVQ